MREMISMVVVVTLLAAVSGGLLATVKTQTAPLIEVQELKFVKGPTLEKILAGVSNDFLADRFKLKDGDTEHSFFVGVKDGEPDLVAFEAYGSGYGGKMGVMVAVNTTDNKVVGVGVTTHSETPGLGARAKTDPAFAAQFVGMDVEQNFAVKGDGGDVDALSGATITSRGVCAALNQAGEIYKKLKPEIELQAKQFAKS